MAEGAPDQTLGHGRSLPRRRQWPGGTHTSHPDHPTYRRHPAPSRVLRVKHLRKDPISPCVAVQIDYRRDILLFTGTDDAVTAARQILKGLMPPPTPSSAQMPRP